MVKACLVVPCLITSFNFCFQDFTVTVLLHVSWFDQRFAPYRIENLEEGYIEIDSKNMDKLWVPDLYFPNEKQAYYHNVLMPNKMLRIHEGGHVEYSARYLHYLVYRYTLVNSRKVAHASETVL